MTSLRIIPTRIAGLFSKRRIDDEIADELRFHLRMRVEENVRRGQSLEEAEQNARRAFGNLELIKEQSRDVRGGGLLESILKDFLFGWRILCRRKASTALVATILALGIGGSAAIVGDAAVSYLWKLPYFEPDRLVRLSQKTGAAEGLPISPERVRSLSAHTSVFSGIASYQFEKGIASIGGKRRAVQAEAVSADFFDVLGRPLVLGRDFRPSDEIPDAKAVCIVEEEFWRRKFASSPKIIGALLTVNGTPSIVIGVVALSQPLTEEVFVPLSATIRHSTQGPFAVARLKPGVSVKQAQSQIDELERTPDRSITVSALQEDFVALSLSNLLILVAAVLLLIIGCINASDLVLAYGSRRGNEFAIRMTLGASRTRIIRQLVSENVTLLMLGSILGLIVSLTVTASLRQLFLHQASSATTVSQLPVVNRPVFLATCLFAFITISFFSVISGLPTSNRALPHGLKSTGNRTTRQNQTTRSGLVIFQIAICLALLFGALCAWRGFKAKDTRDPGFDTSNLFEVELPFAFAGKRDAVYLADQLLAKLRRIEGIEAAAYCSNGLADVMTCQYKVGPPNTPITQPATLSIVSSNYLATLRPRFLTRDKTSDNRPISIINQPLAEREFHGGDPLGQALTIQILNGELETRVAGVTSYLNQYGVENPELPRAQIFLPISSVPTTIAPAALSQLKLLVRTNRDISELQPAIEQTIRAMDRNQPSLQFKPLSRLLSGSMGQRKYKLFVFLSFASISILLAVASLYSLISHTITQKIREIAIRMALGSSAFEIHRLIARRAVKLLIVGVGAGIGLIVVLNNLLAWQQGTSTTIWSTIVIASLFTLGALAASYLLVRRATLIDPNVVLRHE
jgi:predicted permease